MFDGGVIRGYGIFSEWVHAVGLQDARCAALFDCHNVVNTLSSEEAVMVSVELEHLSSSVSFMPLLLCSHPKESSVDVFNLDHSWAPMVHQMHGYIFTDERKSLEKSVRVYRPEGYPLTSIHVEGDKSFLSRALAMPTLLFDDEEENVTFHNRGSDWNQGVVVKRAGQVDCNHLCGYRYCADPQQWVEIVRQFGVSHGAIPASVPPPSSSGGAYSADGGAEGAPVLAQDPFRSILAWHPAYEWDTYRDYRLINS